MAHSLRSRTYDLQLDNDDSALALTSGPVRELGVGSRRWSRAVGRGYLLPLALPTTCHTVARVVLGPLAPSLAAATAATARHHLELLDDSLVICSSRDWIERGRSHARTFTIAVPAGDYQVEVRVLVASPGGAELCAAADRDLGAWWDRTRRGQARPRWIAEHDVDRRPALVELVLVVDRLRGRRPPRQALDLVDGDYLSPDRFITRLPRRCPDAVPGRPRGRLAEVRDSLDRRRATAALMRALDTPTAAERRAEAASDARLARAQAEHERHLTEVRAQLATRAAQRRARAEVAVAERRRVGTVGRKPLWAWDLLGQGTIDPPRLAAADAAAAALGLRPLVDLVIAQDFPMCFRAYAAPAGDACALFVGDQTLRAFEVISWFSDQRTLVTAYNGWFARVPATVTVEPQADLANDALGQLWQRHHARRQAFGATASPRAVATAIDALIADLRPVLSIHT